MKCLQLEKVELNDGLEDIFDDAFLYCESLMEIKIPESVSRVGPNAFKHCQKMNLAIVGSKTEFNASSFLGCDSLREVIVHGNAGSNIRRAFRAMNGRIVCKIY